MIALLLTYRYLIFIPLSIIEGPIVTVIAGFLVSTGVFNPVIIYLIALVGDFLGDTGLYLLGRYGNKFIHRYGSKIGITAERMKEAASFFAQHHHKAISFSKLLHGVGFVGLITAGSLKISFKRYIKTCFFITAVQSFIMLLIGILFGHAYIKIGKYLNYYAAITSVIVLVCIFFFAWSRFKRRTI